MEARIEVDIVGFGSRICPFTAISVVRGYVWRRVFNRRLLHKLIGE